MLIHLSTVADAPFISIDPEGGPIPLIESVSPAPGVRTTFRLSFPSVDDSAGFDVPSGGAAQPARVSHPAPVERPEIETQGKGRMWRYGGMTLAFAGMLVVGMVISTVLHSGSGADAGPEMAGSESTGAIVSTGASPPPSVVYRQPFSRDVVAPATRLPPDAIEHDGPTEVTQRPLPSEPVIQPAPQPASVPPPAPIPANPGALFGLHS